MAAADVQVTFGADISQIGTASNAVKAQLRELGADAENTSGSIHGATGRRSGPASSARSAMSCRPAAIARRTAHS